MNQRERKPRTVEEKTLLRVLGRQLAAWRQEQNITQEALAEMAGVGSKYVSEIECGKTNLTVLRLWRVSQALEMELWEACCLAAADKEGESRLRVSLGRLLKKQQGKDLEKAKELLTLFFS